MVVKRKDAKEKARKERPVALCDLCISLCALRDNRQFGCAKRSLNAKTQRKRHAKNAQLHFVISAFPFVPSAIIGSLDVQNGRQTQRRKGKGTQRTPSCTL
jgi:hypothetical protein